MNLLKYFQYPKYQKLQQALEATHLHIYLEGKLSKFYKFCKFRNIQKFSGFSSYNKRFNKQSHINQTKHFQYMYAQNIFF